MTEKLDCEIYDDGFVIIDGNEVVPIVTWFDEFGDECDAADAVAATAGPTANGKWISIAIHTQERPRLH